MVDERVERIVPVSAAQEGVLVHCVGENVVGLYIGQQILELAGPLDHDLFRAAWERVAQRHPVLRSGVVWEGVRRPVQVVYRQPVVSVEPLDWVALAEPEARGRLDTVLALDRAHGFVLPRAPLWRVTLARRAADLHWLVLTFHHAVLDGWSIAAAVDEFFHCYERLATGTPVDLPEPLPFWAQHDRRDDHDHAAAVEHWRRRLAGFPHRPALFAPVGGGTPARAGLRRVLSPGQRATAERMARDARVTLGTLVNGAWGRALAAVAGVPEVVFGQIAADRPADLPGAERILGFLTTALPCRFRAPEPGPPDRWLRDLQGDLAADREHGRLPLGELLGVAGVPAGTELFDSIVIVQNLPQPDGSGLARLGLRVTGGRGVDRPHYPLAVSVTAGDELTAAFDYDPARCATATVEALADAFAAALVDPAGRIASARVAPSAPRLPEPATAELMAGVRVTDAIRQAWRDVLKIDTVDEDDNFFALGGDSVLGIHLVSTMARAGVTITARQIFDHPTPRGLAAVATVAGRRTSHPPGRGPAVLAPIQRWFFAHHLAHPGHWNQGRLYVPGNDLDTAALAQATAAVIRHHDALRLVFAPPATRSGQWQARHVSPTPGWLASAFRDLRPDTDLAGALRWLQDFDLSTGPLLRVAHVDAGTAGHRILVVAHHLVVDAVSWPILLDDLARAYSSLRAGARPALDARTTSFAAWTAELSRTTTAESDPSVADPGVLPMPAIADLTTPAYSRDAAERNHPLGAARSKLLAECARAGRAAPDEILVAAAAEAAGGPLRVDVERHGRDRAGGDGIDLSRTVGWFTAITPVSLDPGRSGDLVGEARRQLRDPTPRGAARNRAEVLLNYLGGHAGADPLTTGLGWRAAPERLGTRHPDNRLTHLVEINVHGEGEDLVCQVTYSARHVTEAAVTEFLHRLGDRAEALAQDRLSGSAPHAADFPRSGLSQLDLDQLFADLFDDR